jgi:hypothetical protein
LTYDTASSTSISTAAAVAYVLTNRNKIRIQQYKNVTTHVPDQSPFLTLPFTYISMCSCHAILASLMHMDMVSGFIANPNIQQIIPEKPAPHSKSTTRT